MYWNMSMFISSAWVAGKYTFLTLLLSVISSIVWLRAACIVGTYLYCRNVSFQPSFHSWFFFFSEIFCIVCGIVCIFFISNHPVQSGNGYNCKFSASKQIPFSFNFVHENCTIFKHSLSTCLINNYNTMLQFGRVDRTTWSDCRRSTYCSFL